MSKDWYEQDGASLYVNWGNAAAPPAAADIANIINGGIASLTAAAPASGAFATVTVQRTGGVSELQIGPGAALSTGGFNLGNSTNQAGTLTMTGGSVTTTGRVSMAGATGAVAAIDLSGGTITAAELRVMPAATVATASISVSGTGSLEVKTAQFMGGNSGLTFSQTGGTMNFSGRTSVTGGSWSISDGEFLGTGDRLEFNGNATSATTINVSGGTFRYANAGTTTSYGLRLGTTGTTVTLSQSAGSVDIDGGTGTGSLARNVTLGGTSSYALSGTGTLRVAGSISGAAGSSFSFAGGALNAATIDMTNLGGTLTNQGGEFSVGDITGAGRTVVTGNFTQTAGSLVFGLGGTTQAAAFLAPAGTYDLLSITGTATLGGALDVSLIDGFTLADSQLFGIIDATSASGGFTGLSEGTTVLSNNGYELKITYAGLITSPTEISTSGGTDVVLYTVAIPEPGAALLVGTFATFGLLRRRVRG